MLLSLVNRYLLTPWCRVLLEKLTGLQLVKKFSAFYRTQKFITALTRGGGGGGGGVVCLGGGFG